MEGGMEGQPGGLAPLQGKNSMEFRETTEKPVLTLAQKVLGTTRAREVNSKFSIESQSFSGLQLLGHHPAIHSAHCDWSSYSH